MNVAIQDEARREIAARALDTADQFLAAAERLLDGLTVQLRDAQPEAMGDLARLLDGIASLARLSADLDLLGGVQRGVIRLEELRAMVESLVAQGERQDWPGVGRTLEQQLKPRLGQWRAGFASAASAIA